MKDLKKAVFVTTILLLLVSPSTAQIDELKEMTVVVPAESIDKVIKPLLPYKLILGKDFVGDFYVKSIDNIRIKKDKISFSSLIVGKDIKYATKIGKQIVNFVVGEVNLSNNWELSFKFDKNKKSLLVTPSLQEIKDQKDFSQGDALLNSLLAALAGIEYPIDLNNIKPVKSEFYNQLLTLQTNISDIYTAHDKLFIEIKPIVKIKSLK